MRQIIKKIKKDEKGNILLFAMVFGAISFAVIIVGVAGYAISENRASILKHNSEEAFQIADAGINYYRWHLAHDKTDFFDNTSSTGPYVHDYKDKSGNVIGHFSLQIGQPATGTTIVVMTSTGWLNIQPQSRRSIKVRLGFPSLTDYAFLTNTDIWIGTDESTHGKFHSNAGIRFDGTGDAPITSAVATYTCKPYHGCSNQTKPGIWGAGGPSSYWSFPQPAKDFNIITVDLAQIRTKAQEDGLYFSSSGQQGWRLEFTSSGQVKAYKVSATNCYAAQDVASSTTFWPCIDIKTTDTPDIYNMPANGYIFAEDTVWVDGTVKGRATVGTATGESIIINGNITYAAKDGTNVLGLIAERDILVPHDSPNNLEIDAALLAQNGAAKRYYYSGNVKNSLTLYGSIITANIWTWTWVSGSTVVSGYRYTSSTYDANLTYGPPPNFPVGSEYNLISWEEVR